MSDGGAPTTLLLGMGNPILSDDSVGVRLARDLRIRLGEVPGLECVEECSVGGLNLIDQLVGFDRVVVIDSIKTSGGKAGDWYRFTAGDLRETMNLSNVHDANFATALELGRRLGHPLPAEDRIIICAVEVEDNTTFSESLTAGLTAAYPALCEEILREVEGILRSQETVRQRQ